MDWCLAYWIRRVTNRPQAKDGTMAAEVKKNRPIEEKESNRRLVTMENARRNIPKEQKVMAVRDREGDMRVI
jgi:hypothetical protein